MLTFTPSMRFQMKSKKSYPGYLKGFLYYQVFFPNSGMFPYPLRIQQMIFSAGYYWQIVCELAQEQQGMLFMWDVVYVHVNKILAYELLVLRDK